jgi:hypothetical protein
MRRRRKAKRTVSASALSQMGVCERLVVFEHFEGKRPTTARRGRCFIATHVFGDGPETQVLRLFRDRYLRPTRAGRSLILAYYRLAPTVCRAMERWPMTRSAVGAAIKPLVWLATCLLADQEASHASG